MKIAVLALFTLSLTAVAQQPVPPQPTAAQVELTKEATALQSKTQLDYNKLRDLSEFQEYLNDVQKMQQLQQRYQAAAVKPAAPKPATK